MKATTKNGKRDATITKLVVKLRDVDNLSWTNIRGRLADRKVPVVISGSTVRRIYDEGKGYKGAYYESRPLVGGRYRQVKDEGAKPEAKTDSKPKATRKAPAKAKTTPKASEGTAPKRGSAAGRGPVKATKATKATAPAPEASPEPAKEQAS